MSQAIVEKTRTKETSPGENKFISLEENHEQLDLLTQLLKPEVQESLTDLVENLPKLAEMAAFITTSYDTAQAIMKDRILMNDLIDGLQELANPLMGKVKEFAATAIEANDRVYESQPAAIGLFGLLRMLKDPQVQKMFQFVQACLEISAEKHKRQ